MSHTATTTISRFFEKTRGKALSATWLGLSAAEFIFPVLIVFLLTITSWRNIWITISILVLLILPIISFLLVRKVKLDSREPLLNDQVSKLKIKDWTRSEVLKDLELRTGIHTSTFDIDPYKSANLEGMRAVTLFIKSMLKQPQEKK